MVANPINAVLIRGNRFLPRLQRRPPRKRGSAPREDPYPRILCPSAVRLQFAFIRVPFAVYPRLLKIELSKSVLAANVGGVWNKPVARGSR
jgi:hypothetical protein